VSSAILSRPSLKMQAVRFCYAIRRLVHVRALRFVPAVLLCVSAIFVPFAHAQFDAPMTFRQLNLSLSGTAVLAEGEITGDTPAQFTAFLLTHPSVGAVYLNSPGGNLGAGIDLGRQIRRAGLDTRLGGSPVSSFGMPAAGQCYSSCTFAFLGGVSRSVTSDSHFGVHRFEGTQSGGDAQQLMQLTQELAGELVSYVREMGVSTEMYTLMTTAGPDDIRELDLPTMQRLNIVTTGKAEAKLVVEQGVSILRLTDSFTGGATVGKQNFQGRFDFYCNGPSLFARAFVHAQLTPQPQALQASWLITPSTSAIDIPPQDLRVQQSSDMVIADVYVPPPLLNRIADATSLGLTLGGGPPGGRAAGLDNTSNSMPSDFRTLLNTLATSCH
jgi:hypothetical protein